MNGRNAKQESFGVFIEVNFRSQLRRNIDSATHTLGLCRGDHLLQHEHISSHCTGLMTMMKPHMFFSFTKLREESKLKVVGYLMRHWSTYNRDPVETQSSTQELHLPPSMPPGLTLISQHPPRFLKQVGNAQIAGHTSRGSSGALVENSADAVRTVPSPVRETFESLLLLTPLQLLGILNAHLLW